ncbi:hypothetical protein ACHAW6_006272 [Cyclotella cf. meneghiniana]
MQSMQGYPESPRMWEKWWDNMVKSHNFKPTTHEPCINSGIWHVPSYDDFEFATPSMRLANAFYDAIDENLSMPINQQGMILHKNFGEKCPLPIPTHESFLKTFNTAVGDNVPHTLEALQNRFKFGHRNEVGGLNYAMLSKHAIKYLVATRKDGIYFLHATPLMDLPEHPQPGCTTALHGQLPPNVSRPEHAQLDMHAYVDSDWGTCPKSCRSLTGIIVKLAGGTIAYKTKLQPMVTLSSTEAEFMAACDAGKMILFIWRILWDLWIPQQAATVMYKDNDACTAMENAQQPMTCTRHMDI